MSTKSTWNYMVNGAIVIEEEGQPLKIIDPQEDGCIRFKLQSQGPAISDPPIRLCTHEENNLWILGKL